MSTDLPPDEGFLDVYVEPKVFPWLVIAVLDVMHDTDFQFNIPALDTIVPRDGHLVFGGVDRYEARQAVQARLGELGIRTSEVSLA